MARLKSKFFEPGDRGGSRKRSRDSVSFIRVGDVRGIASGSSGRGRGRGRESSSSGSGSGSDSDGDEDEDGSEDEEWSGIGRPKRAETNTIPVAKVVRPTPTSVSISLRSESAEAMRAGTSLAFRKLNRQVDEDGMDEDDEEETMVGVTIPQLKLKHVARADTCPQCLAGFNGNLDVDSEPYLYELWHTTFEQFKLRHPIERIAVDVVAGYEKIVRIPLLRDREKCDSWKAADVESHLRDHVMDEEFKLINDIRLLELTQTLLANDCFEINPITKRTKSKHNQIRDLIALQKSKAQQYAALSKRSAANIAGGGGGGGGGR